MNVTFTDVRASLPVAFVFIFLLFDMFTGGSNSFILFGLLSPLVSLNKKRDDQTGLKKRNIKFPMETVCLFEQKKRIRRDALRSCLGSTWGQSYNPVRSLLRRA